MILPNLGDSSGVSFRARHSLALEGDSAQNKLSAVDKYVIEFMNQSNSWCASGDRNGLFSSRLGVIAQREARTPVQLAFPLGVQPSGWLTRVFAFSGCDADIESAITKKQETRR